MASIFGDDGIDDLFGDHDENHEANELPGEEDDNDELNQEEGANQDEEGKPVKVEPKPKRAVRNPRLKLSMDTLAGPRGIHTIEDYFKDVKFKGKGYEKQDLNEILRHLQHWAHRMYPTYTFDDVLNNIERLGKKKPLQVHMSRYRLGLLENLRKSDEAIAEDDEDAEGVPDLDEPYDEFDALLGEQIAISKLAPRTPAHSSHYGSYPNTPAKTNSTFASPSFHQNHLAMSTPYSTAALGGSNVDSSTSRINYLDMSDLAQPLPPSQPASPSKNQLNSEQMARIAENRRLAQERLKAKQQKHQIQKEQNETIVEE